MIENGKKKRKSSKIDKILKSQELLSQCSAKLSKIEQALNNDSELFENNEVLLENLKQVVQTCTSGDISPEDYKILDDICIALDIQESIHENSEEINEVVKEASKDPVVEKVDSETKEVNPQQSNLMSMEKLLLDLESGLTKFNKLEGEDRKDQKNFMDMFQKSFQERPLLSEFYPTSIKKESTNTSKPSILPQSRMIDESVISKMDLDTLFFIFYYSKVTYEKYLAAKELKKREWRYNKKFFAWFKRHDPPIKTTDEYEVGNFLIFDFEDTFRVKKRNNFTFEYKHLEDEV